MSRRIAVRLYEKIVELRPDWHSDDPTQGKIKVVMTGSAADPAEFQPHIYQQGRAQGPQEARQGPGRPARARHRARHVADRLRLPLDAHHVRRQADAWRRADAGDRPGQPDLPRQARRPDRRLHRRLRQPAGSPQEYSPSDRDQAGVPIEELVAAMLEKHDIVRGLLHGCDFDSSPDLPPAQRLAQHAKMLDFVMADPDRTQRFNDQALALAKAFALCGARDEAKAIHNDTRMFIDVRSAILKIQNPESGRGGSGAVEIDTAIGQLVNEAITADQVIDIYKLAGVETPELSILSDEFLDSLAHKDRPNLQMGLLRRLLNDQVKTVQRTNVVTARSSPNSSKKPSIATPTDR